jgi:hypothetical protein
MNMVIVGGGSAGWITANLLAKHFIPKGITISLIESDDIPTIGVGEGSTPQLASFMDEIGIAEADWLTQCNATYKNGIKFTNWSTREGYQDYFHPFPAQTDDHTVPGFFHNSYLMRKGIDLPSHPDPFFLSTKLASQNKIPVPNDNFPFEVNYGYHFDASLFAKVLRSHAESKGVNRIGGTVSSIIRDKDGNIELLHLRSGQEIKGDFFVDCSGAAALLIEKTLHSSFTSFSSNLFNNNAVVLSTPVKPKVIGSFTESTAMSNGWRWEIPLTNRIGNGYVYSDNFIDANAAETELRHALGLIDADVSAKHLSMRVGFFKQSWKQNCVAIGMSQGFIEPLEATALHITIESVQGFIATFLQSENMQTKRSKYNVKIEQRYEAIRDYIVAHYKLNSRSDTDYWRENSENPYISASLAAIINSWTAGKNLSDELSQQNIDNYYPAVSWHCLLAGYGILPNHEDLVAGNADANRYNLAKIRTFIDKCATHYQDQFAYLQNIKCMTSKTTIA